eukprot:11152313-Lingulodinium_polyedra.AAC.1
MTAPRPTRPGIGSGGLAMSSPGRSSRTQSSSERGWLTMTKRARPRCFASRRATWQKAKWACQP